MTTLADLAPVRYLDRTTPPHITTLVLMTATAAIATNLFLPSLPTMAEEFGTSYAIIQLAVTGYLALTGFVQLAIGPVSDRVGRRPVMIAALAIFVLASIGAAHATSLTAFLAFRALQASSVAGFVVSRAAIRDMVGRERAASMIGYVTMGMALAPMIAPAVGGALGDAFGWRSNFHALALAGMATLIVIWFDQGETNRHRSGSFREQARAYPALLRSRRFRGYALSMMFASGTFFAYLGGAPYVGAVVYGLSATELGLYLAITPLGYATGNGVSGRFAERVGLYRMMIGGASITLGFMSITLLTAMAEVAHPLGFFAFTFAIGLGNGIVLPSASAGMLDLRPDLAGSAAGLGGALMTFGGAVLSGLAAFTLTETSGAYPLIFCILASSTLCLASILYTIRAEKRAGTVET